MEDMKKEQLEVLNEAKGYCANVLHCIDTVVPDNATRDLTAGAQPAVDEADGNKAVKELSAALKSGDDSAKADALVKVRVFIAQFKECAEAVCK